LKIGTEIVCSTVSIQNVAVIFTVWAFGTACAFGGRAEGLPTRKAMLSVPPANSGRAGLVDIDIWVVLVIVCPTIWLRKTVFGSFRIACVAASCSFSST
jgi:hypothetical protein